MAQKVTCPGSKKGLAPFHASWGGQSLSREINWCRYKLTHTRAWPRRRCESGNSGHAGDVAPPPFWYSLTGRRDRPSAGAGTPAPASGTGAARALDVPLRSRRPCGSGLPRCLPSASVIGSVTSVPGLIQALGQLRTEPGTPSAPTSCLLMLLSFVASRFISQRRWQQPWWPQAERRQACCVWPRDSGGWSDVRRVACDPMTQEKTTPLPCSASALPALCLPPPPSSWVWTLGYTSLPGPARSQDVLLTAGGWSVSLRAQTHTQPLLPGGSHPGGWVATWRGHVDTPPRPPQVGWRPQLKGRTRRWRWSFSDHPPEAHCYQIGKVREHLASRTLPITPEF